MAGYLSLGELGLDLHPVPFLPATSNPREQHHLGFWTRSTNSLRMEQEATRTKNLQFFGCRLLCGECRTAPFLADVIHTFDINPCPIGTMRSKTSEQKSEMSCQQPDCPEFLTHNGHSLRSFSSVSVSCGSCHNTTWLSGEKVGSSGSSPLPQAASILL